MAYGRNISSFTLAASYLLFSYLLSSLFSLWTEVYELLNEIKIIKFQDPLHISIHITVCKFSCRFNILSYCIILLSLSFSYLLSGTT